MHLGIAVGETWAFFHEVHAYLSERHDTSLFERRILDLPILNGRLNRYRFQRDLSRFMRAHDVVFFEWASELLSAATHLPKTTGIVTRLHRYELYQWAGRVNWSAVDRIILVSRAKYHEFATMFPEHAHKAVVIPEAVSVERFRPSAKPFAGDIGILCHMKPRKRVYELVLAFSELLEASPDFHLHIGGGRAEGFGEYYEAVRQLVKHLGIQDKVTFYGRVSKPEEWYPRVDICISNGYSEGLQVSPLEAMASGCYCLSHHWDGADELLPATNLYYTNTQLNRSILEYARKSDTEKAALKAEMRRIVCDNFNVDTTKMQIDQVVEEARHALHA